MLSHHSVLQIANKLDRTVFTSDAFEIVMNDPEDNHCWVKIIFKDDKTMFLRVGHDQMNGSPMIHIAFSPGGVFELGGHTYSYDTDSQALRIILDSIPEWVRAIEAELNAKNLLQQDLDKWKSNLNKTLETHYPDPTEHYRNEEATEIRRQLDEMEQAFTSRQNATEAEIQKLKKTINELKESLGTLPKKTWVRSAIRKIGDVTFKMATSKPGQQLLMDGVTKLLS